MYLYCASIPWNYQQTFLWIISSVSSAYKIYEIRALHFNCFRASALFVLYMHIAHFKFHISIPNSRKVSREFDANLQIHDPIYRLHTVVMKYHRSCALYKCAPHSFPNDAPIYIHIPYGITNHHQFRWIQRKQCASGFWWPALDLPYEAHITVSALSL